MRHRLSRMGASLGNWNDRTNHGLRDDPRRPRTWRMLERVAAFLHTLPDRPHA